MPLLRKAGLRTKLRGSPGDHHATELRNVQQAPELDTAAAPTTSSFPCRPQTPGGAEDLRNGLVAGAVAGIISGAPSTLYALVTGGDPLKATLAAGSLLLPRAQRTFTLLAAALPVHLALSVGWGYVLTVTLPRRHTATAGAVAGLVIAALDLGLIGRRLPRVRALPLGPQVADHLVYGAGVGAIVGYRRAHARHDAQPAPARRGTAGIDGSSPDHIHAQIQVAAPADEVFNFLSDLENHWLVADRFIDIISLDRSGGGGATGGRVTIRGPLGLRRTADTQVVGADPPRRMSGTASIGRRTRGRITWTLSTPHPDVTAVRLAASIQAAGPLDRALLLLRGRRWLQSRFQATLANLAKRWG